MHEMPAKISRRVFDSLPEYSCTIPTGAYPMKRWKRGKYDLKTETWTWYMGEYTDTIGKNRRGKEYIGIFWTLIEVYDYE